MARLRLTIFTMATFLALAAFTLSSVAQQPAPGAQGGRGGGGRGPGGFGFSNRPQARRILKLLRAAPRR